MGNLAYGGVAKRKGGGEAVRTEKEELEVLTSPRKNRVPPLEAARRVGRQGSGGRHGKER